MKRLLYLALALSAQPLTAMEKSSMPPQQAIFLLKIALGLSKHGLDYMQAKLQSNQKRDKLNAQLLLAVVGGDLNFVKQYIAAGADLEASTFNATVLMWAAANGHAEICASLIHAGANIDAEANGQTALYMAIHNRKEAACKALIKAGADINKKCDLGFSPFAKAACGGLKTICALLLDAGCILTPHDVEVIHSFNDLLYPITIPHAIFSPDAQTIKASRERIFTALLCLKRCCPYLPKGVDKLILISPPLAMDIGHIMIAERLKGKRVVFPTFKATVEALYVSTLEQLAKIAHTTPLELENSYGDAIRKNARRRLLHETLTCNNTLDEKSDACVIQ